MSARETEHEDRAADVGADSGPGKLDRVFRVLAAFKTVLLLLSLGVNVVLVAKILWKPQGDVHETVNAVESLDSNGKVAARSHFGTFATIPYRVDTFSRGGDLLSTAIDENEDGWFERSSSFDKDELIAIHTDANEDGSYERVEYFHRRQRVWSHSDKDENGTYESSVGYKDGQATVQWDDVDQDSRTERMQLLNRASPMKSILLDRDKDGFPEIAQCVGPDGEEHVWNLIDCR